MSFLNAFEKIASPTYEFDSSTGEYIGRRPHRFRSNAGGGGMPGRSRSRGHSKPRGGGGGNPFKGLGGHAAKMGILTGMGALLGGEEDRHGQVYNRHIGALRYGSGALGHIIGDKIADKLIKTRSKNTLRNLHNAFAKSGIRITSTLAGILAAHQLGPKYDYEKRLEAARAKAKKRK